ncbi:MAG: hypothetical protein IPK13_27420 [Deltaproteobacteria bacterium]|nr:hypothetical protein [Deltaproteobacteria bacterium]
MRDVSVAVALAVGDHAMNPATGHQVCASTDVFFGCNHVALQVEEATGRVEGLKAFGGGFPADQRVAFDPVHPGKDFARALASVSDDAKMLVSRVPLGHRTARLGDVLQPSLRLFESIRSTNGNRRVSISRGSW